MQAYISFHEDFRYLFGFEKAIRSLSIYI